MNSSSTDGPQIVRTSEGEGARAEEEEEAEISEDVGAHQLLDTIRADTPATTSTGTTLRKRTKLKKESLEGKTK